MPEAVAFSVLPSMIVRSTALCAITLVALLQSQLVPVPALAQTVIRFWPTQVEMEANVGQSAERAITLENPSHESVTVNVYGMDFSVGRDECFTFSEPCDESYSCSSWLTVDEAFFELGAGETRAVKVTVAVPDGVEPGGHHAALLFEACLLDAETDSSVNISSRIASLFYVTIPGVSEADITTDAEIVSLILPAWVEGSSAELGVVVRNTGNVHLNIAGKMYLTGFRGNSIAEVDLGQTIVLPGTERTLKGDCGGLPLFDKVTTKVVVGYFDAGGEVVNRSAQGGFWVTPHRGLMAAVALPVGIILLVTFRLRRRYRLKIERKSE